MCCFMVDLLGDLFPVDEDHNQAANREGRRQKERKSCVKLVSSLRAKEALCKQESLSSCPRFLIFLISALKQAS